MSQTQNTQNLSQAYKGYKARQKAAGKDALPFNLWKDRYGLRKPRTKGRQAVMQAVDSALIQGAQPVVEQPTPDVQAIIQAVLAQVNGTQQAAPAPVQQPDTQAHVEIRNPDEQATGRQLWKLMNLGLIPFISKGDASAMIEQAVATA